MNTITYNNMQRQSLSPSSVTLSNDVKYDKRTNKHFTPGFNKLKQHNRNTNPCESFLSNIFILFYSETSADNRILPVIKKKS